MSAGKDGAQIREVLPWNWATAGFFKISAITKVCNMQPFQVVNLETGKNPIPFFKALNFHLWDQFNILVRAGAEGSFWMGAFPEKPQWVKSLQLLEYGWFVTLANLLCCKLSLLLLAISPNSARVIYVNRIGTYLWGRTHQMYNVAQRGNKDSH